VTRLADQYVRILIVLAPLGFIAAGNARERRQANS